MLASSVVCAAAQNEESARQAIAEAVAANGKRSYRVTKTLEMGHKDAVPTKIHRTITEFVPPDRMYVSTKVVRETCGFNYWYYTMDLLFIGEKEYERRGGGPWKEILPAEDDTKDNAPTAKGTWSYRLVGTEKPFGITIGIWEMSWQGEAERDIYKTTFWINEQSKMIGKTVTETRHGSDRYAFYSREVGIYEYDPRITIAAPSESSQK